MISKLYLICSHSCMSQMEIPFLLNNSPDVRESIDPDSCWATYELNNIEIDHEPGIFGKVRVHDDYWNIDDDGREFYNYEVRNTMHITSDQLDGLYTLYTQRGTIALLLHAHNTDDIMRWAKDKQVMVITTAIGHWERDIELWAMREFNYLMEDDRNANYSDEDHSTRDLDQIVDAFIHRMHVDKEWRERDSDVLLYQTEWQRIPDIYNLWSKVGLTPPPKEWIDKYIETFYNKQQFETSLLYDLREVYEAHDEYSKLF